MTTTKDGNFIKVKFDRDDWNNGKARKAIDLIKSFSGKNGKKMGWYSGLTKQWTVIETPFTREKIEELEKEGHEDRVELGQFSFEEFWNEAESRNK